MSEPVVTNAADAARAAFVCQALCDVVATDPRVRSAYQRWLAAHGLPVLIRRYLELPAPASACAIRDAILRDDPADAVLLTAVLAELGISDYGWLQQLLRAVWATWALYEATGERTALVLSPRPASRGTLPVGRAPKHGPSQQEDQARNISWFYRARIKEPPDPISAIAREYAAAAHRQPHPITGVLDARSVVQNGIRRAKTLLDCVVAGPSAI